MSARKIIATIFLDRKCVIIIDFLVRGTTVNSQRYCQTLVNLRRAIKTKHRGKVSSKIQQLHDNPQPQMANRPQEVLDSFKREMFLHPQYTPDLAPTDYYLFPLMKKWHATQCLDDDAELWEGMTKCYRRHNFQSLFHYKCLHLYGNNVKKSF